MSSAGNCASFRIKMVIIKLTAVSYKILDYTDNRFKFEVNTYEDLAFSYRSRYY